METSNRVNDDRIVDNSWFVYFVEILYGVITLRWIILGTIDAIINIEAVYSIWVFAKSTYSTY